MCRLLKSKVLLGFLSWVHVGFSQLSSDCTAAIVSVASQPDAPNCLIPITATLTSAANYSECVKQLNGVDCMNPYSVIDYAGGSDKAILYPTPLQPPSSCPLCSPNQGILAPCSRLLGDVLLALSGVTDGMSPALRNISLFCSGEEIPLAMLRYQSMVVCASSSSYGFSVTPYGTLDNVLDMRYLTQCGTCGMMPCLPGQLCAANREPEVCPGGYYCPDGADAIQCPRGFYCPKGSMQPIKCQSLAFGTCPKGSERDVVWAPLVWSVALLIVIYLSTFYGPKALQDAIGYERKVKNSQAPVYSKSEISEADMKVSSLSIEINFDGVNLVTKEVKRLNSVSGSIKCGKFTAIMGASGAGKTTMMNALMGKESICGGTIEYSDARSGCKIAQSALKTSVAFVPQDDVLLREMTVEQLLYQSAAWRLPTDMSKDEKYRYVEDVISKLKLGAIRHTVVGGGESSRSGISPGARKLVNIAVELVSKPACMFLDEPTTNLDASSAMNVATIVNGLAKLSMTCVAVIHQPRREIFALIDDLILLVPGGRMAYNGPANRAIDWFAYVGYELKVKSMNTADYIIDLANGNFEACGIARDNFEPSIDWAQLWLDKGQEFLALPQTSVQVMVPSIALTSDMEMSLVSDNANVNKLGMASVYQPLNANAIFEPKPGFFKQLIEFCHISLLQEIKESRFLWDCLTHLLAGCILGIVNSGGALLQNPLPDTYGASCPPESYEKCQWLLRYQLGPATFYIVSLLGIVVIPSSVRCFGREIPIFRRNYDVGVNTLSYFCGKSLTNMILTVPKVVCFTAPILCIASWSAPFEYLFGLFVVLSICIAGLSYVASLLLDADIAILIMTIYCIVINLVGGFVPLLGDGYHSYLFHARWAARAIVTSELIYGRKFPEELYNSFFNASWKIPDYKMDLIVLMIMAIGYHIIALCLLMRRARQRR